MDFGRILVDALRAAVGVPAAAYALAGIGLNVPLVLVTISS